jgi:hypothetical protein
MEELGQHSTYLHVAGSVGPAGALAGSNHHVARSRGGGGAPGGAGHGGPPGGAGNIVAEAQEAGAAPGGTSHAVHVVGSGGAVWAPCGSRHLAAVVREGVRGVT